MLGEQKAKPVENKALSTLAAALQMYLAPDEMPQTTQSAVLVLTPRQPRRKSLEAKALSAGSVGGGTRMDPLLTGRVRYDSRGNRIAVDATSTPQPIAGQRTRHQGVTGVSTVPVVAYYAIMSTEGKLLALGSERELEAVYDAFGDETLEIVPCQ